MVNEDTEAESQIFSNKLKEQFELDVKKNYEKIDVPAKGKLDVPSKGTNRFVHDFYSVSHISMSLILKTLGSRPLFEHAYV